MKILIVRSAPNKLNMSTYNLQEMGLAKALVRKGHICDVMYFGGKNKNHMQKVEFDNDKEFNIIWMRGYSFCQEGVYPSLLKYTKNYDIIQVGGYVGLTTTGLNIFVGNKVVNYQGPYYCDYCKGEIKRAKIWDNTLLRLVNKKKIILGTKSKLATDYVKSKGFTNVTTIGVGLDLDNLQIDDSSIYENEMVKNIASKKEEIYLLYIGVIEDRRNTLFLLEIVKELKENFPQKNYKLVIIGKGQDSYVNKCKNKIQELGIKHNVIWYEKMEQKYLRAIYELADVFILPSKYEIYGMVMLEAMYFNLPVVTTYNGGSSMMINFENGIIIDDNDPHVWANRIEALLNDKERYKRMCRNAHETIVEKFTWDILADKFLELYKERLDS